MKRLLNLIQVSIGTREQLSVMPTEAEWEEIYQMARRQGVMDIAHAGVSKLVMHHECTIPEDLFIKWSGYTLRHKEKNGILSTQVEKVLRYFRTAGFQAIILKGQSLLPYYPESLRDCRQPGDIDVWVRGKSKKQVYQFLHKDFPNAKYGYLHFHSDATNVEVHIRPAFLCNPYRNYRLQQWADQLDFDALQEPETFRDFNAIYQPLHLFKHLMREGITLRQLLDYYFLLKQQPNTDERLLRKLGIDGFCQDLQAVTLNLFEDVPINTESERRLLEEIMIDVAVIGTEEDNEWKRMKRVVRMYPGEVFWRPYFWIFQKVWKLFI